MSDTKTFPTWDGDDGYVEQPQPPPFGYQLLLDLYGCNEAALCDLGRVYGFLEGLVGLLGMTKQAPPFVFLSPPEYADKRGISGWVPLIESGISIHTLAPRRFVTLDIYCCRKFDAAAVRRLADAVFVPKGAEMRDVIRGRQYRWGAAVWSRL